MPSGVKTGTVLLDLKSYIALELLLRFFVSGYSAAVRSLGVLFFHTRTEHS